MATRSQKIKVGVFLFICIAFLVIILVLVSGMERFPTVTYRAIFCESVTGLDKGGEVRFSGVLVGSVEDILIEEDGHVIALLKIRKDKLPEIREGTTAKLALRGITGISYVELFGKGDGEIIPPNGFIPSQLSFISNITTNFPAALESLNEILDKINLALGEKDTSLKEEIRGIINQINKAASGMARFSDEATSQTRIVSAQLNELIENLNASVGETRNSAQGLISSMENLVRNTDQRISQIDVPTTQRKIHALADRITSTSLSLESLISSSHQSVFQMEYHIHQSLQQLNATLNVAENLLRMIERDPSIFIYGPSPDDKTNGSRR
ncbi:MCE family protein [Candidatus Sumerlaeota bacterium]|nr:MCE family protein [Candidatus Sumerlaeota bacterium]